MGRVNILIWSKANMISHYTTQGRMFMASVLRPELIPNDSGKVKYSKLKFNVVFSVYDCLLFQEPKCL